MPLPPYIKALQCVIVEDLGEGRGYSYIFLSPSVHQNLYL